MKNVTTKQMVPTHVQLRKQRVQMQPTVATEPKFSAFASRTSFVTSANSIMVRL
jgi:hypothetical protein